MWLCHILTPDFRSPELWKCNFCCVKPLALWWFVTQPRKLTQTRRWENKSAGRAGRLLRGESLWPVRARWTQPSCYLSKGSAGPWECLRAGKAPQSPRKAFHSGEQLGKLQQAGNLPWGQPIRLVYWLVLWWKVQGWASSSCLDYKSISVTSENLKMLIPKPVCEPPGHTPHR